MLQVTVHHTDSVASRRGDARDDGGAEARLFLDRSLDDTPPGVRAAHGAQQTAGFTVVAVVYHDHLVVVLG
jgi:hypothetical protein